MQKPFTTSGPMSLGELLDGAFRLYRERFGILVLTAAVFLVPMGILSSILLSNVFGAYMNLFRSILSRSKFGVFGYFQSRLQGFWSHLFRFRLQKTTYFISENRGGSF
ncbi:hypothetical protein KFU94_49340 [Chloroflexi bacterium TSY]|nr:hypothetical protein [Chloroflexi bacterium TSY]